MKKTWLYKQKYYRDSAWNQFQQFIAFQLIPFIVCSAFAIGIVLVLFSPLLLLLWNKA